MELYQPLVRHWLRRGGLPDSEQDDVLQEVFVAVACSLERFRREREGDTFRGWLRGITRNKHLEYVRRRGGQPIAAGGTIAQIQFQQVPNPTSLSETMDETDPEEQAEISALFRRVLQMIRSEFEARTWQAFWQVAIDGRQPIDVASDLQMSVNAVRTAKCRILRRLREETGELPLDPFPP